MTPPWDEWMSRTRYRYVRVSRETGLETEVLTMVKGGSITRNNDVRIMETAEANVVGGLDIGPDLVRIYLEAEWPDGQTASVPLGTFLPVTPSRRVMSGYSTATVKMYGRLQELLDDKFATPVTLASGTNAVDAARSVCEQQGLTVIADDSDYAITNVRTYGVGAKTNDSEVGDTKLDMVNDLLDLAGFRAAKTDAMGNVILERYVAPSDMSPSWEFTEGPTAKFEREMTEERDITDAANHVVVRYESEDSVYVGEAYDTDPNSDLSTVSRGRVITRSYEYTSEPVGSTDSERQAHADKRAATLLRTAQSTIRRVSMTHAYAPVTVNDVARLGYASGDVMGDFEVRVQKIRLVGGCPVGAELRQFVR